MDHTDKSNDYCRNFHYATVQKTICPSITGQSISTVVLSKSMNFYRRYKYILSYYNIQTYRRRTFSPTETYPVRQMMDIQVVCVGIKTVEVIVFLSVCFESHVYYLYFCCGVVKLYPPIEYLGLV